ncbi:MAG: Holliday junction resolvase RuvX [Patescibacteria group bacterium]
MGKILGLDVGERKIGLAVGDTSTGLAFIRPPLLVDQWSAAWASLVGLIDRERIERVVVGWPLNDDGTTGPQAERVQHFINELERRVVIPIIKRDERHSSQAVRREQHQADRPLARGQEDSLAAQLLLESYLSEPV